MKIHAKGLCQRCYFRQWRETNAARVREEKRRQYEQNRAVVISRSAAWREAHPEEARSHSRSYRSRNAHPRIPRTPAQKQAVRRSAEQRRRARKAGTLVNDFTSAQWIEVLGELGEKCFYCGRADLPLQQEHKTPLSRGGLHTKSNIVPACGPCNQKKRDKTVEEFLAQRQFGNIIRDLAWKGWRQYPRSVDA